MKRYKLLKDLPFAKAGETFGLHRGGIKDYITLFKGDEEVYTIQVGENVSEMFDEWFEEVKEPELPKEFFYIVRGKIGKVEYLTFSLNEDTKQEYRNIIEEEKSVGNYFETKEEAEKYLAYLKAKAVIKEDTKGFKPDWTDKKTRKYYGYWDFERGFKNYFEGGKTSWDSLQTTKESNIYFESWEDIEKSFAKHPEEWKAYLTYEQ